MFKGVALALALGASLAGCASNPKVLSLHHGGLCEALGEPPEYEVKGAIRYDQNFIDDKIEAAIGACNWPRPKPRPNDWDQPRKAAAPTPPQAPKKPTLRDRFKKIVRH